MRIPPDVSTAYINLLQHGLQVIRDRLIAEAGSLALIEAEHLHNIPSLISDENLARHRYYFDVERANYLESVDATGNDEAKKFIRIFYRTEWEVIETLFH